MTHSFHGGRPILIVQEAKEVMEVMEEGLEKAPMEETLFLIIMPNTRCLTSIENNPKM